MSSRMAGATLLRHLGPRLFAAAEPVSGLAASARGIMPAAARIFPARMASTDAKQVAAEKPEGAAAPATEQNSDKKAIVSYWGVQPRKLAREDGTEWPWFCFTVPLGHVQGGHVDRRQEAPRAPDAPGQGGLLRGALPARAHGPLLPAPAREPCAAPGDGRRRAAHGGRRAAPPALAPPVRAQRRLDPGPDGGGRERAHAPHDLPRGDAAAVVGARARGRRAGRLLQRLLRGVPRVTQVRTPLRGVPRGGGRALVHRVPQGLGGRQGGEHAGAGHRHRLLAPPRRRHAQGRRHRRARRRGAPPRRQPLRIGHSLPGIDAEGDACAARIPLISSNFSDACSVHHCSFVTLFLLIKFVSLVNRMRCL